MDPKLDPEHKSNSSPRHPKKRRIYQNLNAFFRIIQRFPGHYPLSLLGSGDPTKEALESITAQRQVLEAIKKIHFGHGGFIDNDEQMILYNALKVVCIVHGDGINPRTGLLLALTTQWQVHSIDPIMGGELYIGDPRVAIENKYDVVLPPNMIVHRGMVEGVDIPIPDDTDYVIFVGVHSHADLPDMWKRFAPDVGKHKYKRVAFTLPCCKNVRATLDADSVDDAHIIIQDKNPELELQSDKCHFIVYSDQPLIPKE